MYIFFHYCPTKLEKMGSFFELPKMVKLGYPLVKLFHVMKQFLPRELVFILYSLFFQYSLMSF